MVFYSILHACTVLCSKQSQVDVLSGNWYDCVKFYNHLDSDRLTQSLRFKLVPGIFRISFVCFL